MPCVGNDVVDLGDPENIGKSGDRRFCRRVFNTAELALIAAFPEPDTLLWALWAAKEAAYKAISRDNPSVCSIPRRYPVTLAMASGRSASLPIRGTVETPLGVVFVRIFVENGALHALAAASVEGLNRAVFRVEMLPGRGDDPSLLAREILREGIAGFLDCPVDQLSILKEKERPWAPYITRDGIRLQAGPSLSHDGRFVAVAYDPAEFQVLSSCS